jgi:hypothetical protein
LFYFQAVNHIKNKTKWYKIWMKEY